MSGIEKLKEIKNKVESSGQAEPVVVRTLIEWFGAKRRGVWVVNSIRRGLKELDLITTPDFESAYIDSYISIQKKSEEVVDEPPVESTDNELVGGYDSDPTYRISKLAAANIEPVSVAPQQSLTEAITLMMTNDFSQLPVMTGERDVKGLISWRTIGSRIVLNQHGDKVIDFLEPVKVVSYDSSIFSVIKEVNQSDCVLVRNAQNIISGIITSADLGEQFGILSKPFLILGEIENYVRKLLDGKFTKDQLKDSVDPTDNSREIESVSDLTFGEYLRVIENPERWSSLAINIDRKIFISKLDNIRKIRNSVMHFDPDGIDNSELEQLSQFCEFLRSLERCGAIKK